MTFATPPGAGYRRHLQAAALTAAAALLLATAASGTAAAKPKVGNGKGSKIELRKLGEFDAPVYVDDAPGSSKLVFVVEQTGTIRVLRNNRLLDQPFLRIPGVHHSGEQGLLSVAFAPDYEQSGRLYVYYTADGGAINRVAEFRRTTETTAGRATERVVMDIDHPSYPNHNGGQLQFGPDGFLYIATGDGGGGGDPFDAAQNPNSRLGKLLRIDPTPGNAGAYGTPSSNPFAGSTAGLDEIFATGLRNPWRFSFDRGTGTIVIGDVGQNRWEEVDYEQPTTLNGANFGWNVFEGDHAFAGGPTPARYQAPIHEYAHDGGACAITGGYVVRDTKLKSLYGRYLYGDLCTGKLRSLVPKLGGARRDRPLGHSVPALSSFGEGAHGRIYATSHDGAVFKLKQK